MPFNAFGGGSVVRETGEIVAQTLTQDMIDSRFDEMQRKEEKKKPAAVKEAAPEPEDDPRGFAPTAGSGGHRAVQEIRGSLGT